MGTLPTIEATTDYGQFFAEWEYRIRAMAYRSGLRGDLLEEATQEIGVFLYQGRYLDKYDPNIGEFSTYIFGLIRVRITDFKRDLWKRGQREMIVQELFETDTHPFADPDDVAGSVESAAAVTELEVAIKSVYESLNKYPATKTKNLARLFRDMVAQVLRDDLAPNGTINVQAIADQYGYSRQAMHAQVKTLMGTPEMQRLHDILAKHRR
jgi:DNA-directed RNA polymerase specialized sigma24 family protein